LTPIRPADPIILPGPIVPDLRKGLFTAQAAAGERLFILTLSGVVQDQDMPAYMAALWVIDAARALLDRVELAQRKTEIDVELDGDEYPLLILRVLESRLRLDGRDARDKLHGPSRHPADDTSRLSAFAAELAGRVLGTPQAAREAELIGAVSSGRIVPGAH
jgi:hypothetical protein